MKSSTHKRIVIGIFAAMIFFGLIFIFALLSDTGSGSFRWPSSDKYLAVVRIEDVIYNADKHVAVLREHREDNGIAGVLLRIDSPGGAVAPSQELFREVMAYREAGKPLVVSMGNVAASGGYYIAAPAYKIFASQGTLTGSIGVIFSLPIYEELAKKVGFNVRIIKSGELKDAGNPLRQMNANEVKYFQSIIDDTYEQFLSDVALGRDTEIDSIRPFADGRVFTGKQAYENNLIDAIGGYADALSYLHEITGVPESNEPIEIKERTPFGDWFFSMTQKHIPGAQTLSRPAGLYYLFAP